LSYHLGIDNNLYLASQICKELSLEEVKFELTGCRICQRIISALRSKYFLPTGNRLVECNLHRVANDVTYYKCNLFLLVMDCSTSRFAIWWQLQTGPVDNIVAQLQSMHKVDKTSLLAVTALLRSDFSI